MQYTVSLNFEGSFSSMKNRILALLAITPLVFVCLAEANEPEPATKPTSQSYDSIYWSDGDSGKVGETKFRLANIDAPETRSMKQPGGAKCEAEREIGFDAKEFIVEFTRGKEIRIVRDYGDDRYERLVVDLTADGVDVAQAAVDAGHLRPWPHKNGRAQTDKPDWCAN